MTLDTFDPDDKEEQSYLPVLAQDNRPAILICSLPTETREERQFAYWMLTAPAIPIKDKFKDQISVTNLLVHPIEVTDPNTGEVVMLRRAVLLDADGETIYASSSRGIIKSLRQIFEIYGPPPWEPAIELTPKDVGSNGKNYHILTVPRPKLAAKPSK